MLGRVGLLLTVFCRQYSFAHVGIPAVAGGRADLEYGFAGVLGLHGGQKGFAVLMPLHGIDVWRFDFALAAASMETAARVAYQPTTLESASRARIAARTLIRTEIRYLHKTDHEPRTTTMRISEPIETRGEFWLPGNPDERLPGNLSISESGEVTLEIEGDMKFAFDKSNSDGMAGKLSRIVGLVESGEHVTLENCPYNITSNSERGATSLCRPTLAFIGTSYGKDKKINLTEFRFSVEGLDEWLMLSSGHEQTDVQREYSQTKFQRRDPSIRLASDDTMADFIVESTYSCPPGAPIMDARITKKAYISLRSDKPRGLKHFRDLAYKLCNFLSLALDQPVSMQSISVSNVHEYSNNESIQPLPISLFGQFAPRTERGPIIDKRNVLLPFQRVSNRLEQLMKSWLEVYEANEPAFDMYFLTRSNETLTLNVKLILLLQGIETLHRREGQGEPTMPEEEFADIRSSLLQVCPEDRRMWLEGVLRHANETNYRTRIKDMIRPFQHWLGNSKSRNSFVNKVVDTRNYLTHYDKVIEDRVPGMRDLILLSYRLEALFQLHLLQLIGLSTEDIEFIVRSNYILQSKLTSRSIDIHLFEEDNL